MKEHELLDKFRATTIGVAAMSRIAPDSYSQRSDNNLFLRSRSRFVERSERVDWS